MAAKAHGHRRRKRRFYLREWREASDLTVPSLADVLGITRTSYYRLEGAPHTISVREIELLADAFRIDPAAFWRSPHDTAS